MSVHSKAGGGSRASDEDGRTSVKVGECIVTSKRELPFLCFFWSLGYLSPAGPPIPRRASCVCLSCRVSPSDNGLFLSHLAVRVRPPLRPSDPGFELIPQRFQRSMVQVNSDTSLSIDAPQGRKLFVFDRVFGPEVDQAGIWDYLEDCVNAFTQGYNVSLLAYGQSGAGKSYTMGTSGPSEQDDLEMMGKLNHATPAPVQGRVMTAPVSAVRVANS